jgi:hypothetical protein
LLPASGGEFKPFKRCAPFKPFKPLEMLLLKSAIRNPQSEILRLLPASHL